MVKEYACEKCGKVFSQKGHFINHQKRKRPCKPIENKVIEEKVQEKLQELSENGEIEIKNKNLISNNQNSNIYIMDNMDNKITDNIEMVIGDSNDVLKKYNNTFDLVYIDPPYETNRDFSISNKDNTGFSDKWSGSLYEKWLEEIINNIKKSLTKLGTLVFHISSENSFIAEKVLNNHFSKIEKVYWKRCHGKNTVKNKMGAVIDILFICYQNKHIFNMQYVPIEENSVWAFKNTDNVGQYSLGALKHDKTRKGYEYTINYEGNEYKCENGWKLDKGKVEELISQNRIHFVPKSKNMYIKVYKHEHKGKPLSNLWNDIHSITRTNKDPRLYPTQKPQKLLERIIKLFTNEDSIICDPVCGSGTTGFVADKLNKKCVMVDINEETKDIILKRFKDKIYNI